MAKHLIFSVTSAWRPSKRPLRAARRSGGESVRSWMQESDDFWKLRDNPEYRALLKE